MWRVSATCWVTGDTIVNVSSEVWGLSDTFKLMWQVIWINTDLKCSMCLYSVQTQPVFWSGPPEGSTVTWFTSFTSRLIYQVDPCDQLMSAFIYKSYVFSKDFCFTSLKVYCQPVEHPASVTPVLLLSLNTTTLSLTPIISVQIFHQFSKNRSDKVKEKTNTLRHLRSEPFKHAVHVGFS